MTTSRTWLLFGLGLCVATAACRSQVSSIESGHGASSLADLAAAAAGVAGTTGAVSGTTPQAAAAGDGPMCESAQYNNRKYLRQLSFDLRGTPPSDAEVAQVLSTDAVPDALIDTMLTSPGFLEQVRLWHRAKLLPNLDGFKIEANGLLARDTIPGDVFNGDMGYAGDGFSADPTMVGPSATHLDRTIVDSVQEHGWLRGGQRVPRCDGSLAYPEPAGDPTYTGGDGLTHHYYDPLGIPLPYQDWKHCTNYCVKTDQLNSSDCEAGKHDGDVKPMDAAGNDGSHFLDLPGYHCAAGYTKIINKCKRRMNTADWALTHKCGPAGPNRPTASGQWTYESQFAIHIDGYRMAKHFWSGGNSLKTCSYEAQQNELRKGGDCFDANNKPVGGQCLQDADCVNPDTSNVYHCVPQPTKTCASMMGADESCGCGPNGVFCSPIAPGYETDAKSLTIERLRTALNEEPIKIIQSVVDANEDYFSIFKTNRSFVTGALATAFRYQTESLRGEGGFSFSQPAPRAQIPDVAFDDNTWHSYERSAEHSGVFTTAAYLLRFPTWKSRVAAFRTQFMCRPFLPLGELPAATDPCTSETNLAKRCGCKGCHSTLEPLGAFFGRWAERSPMYLDPARFPKYKAECFHQGGDNSGFPTGLEDCKYYLTQVAYNTVPIPTAALPYEGMLRGFEYRTDEEALRPDIGPSGLAQLAIDSGELQSCTVTSLFTRLVGRPMTDDESADVLPALVQRFESSGHNYRDLVRAIVTSVQYRRVN